MQNNGGEGVREGVGVWVQRLSSILSREGNSRAVLFCRRSLCVGHRKQWLYQAMVSWDSKLQYFPQFIQQNSAEAWPGSGALRQQWYFIITVTKALVFTFCMIINFWRHLLFIVIVLNVDHKVCRAS